MRLLTRTRTYAAALAILLAPVGAFAHGEPPQAAHGGQVQEAHENWVELVLKGDQIHVYVLDTSRKPVPAAQVSGTVTALIDGHMYKVELTPAEGQGLQGKLPVSASGRTPATVSLKISGQPASARFTIES